MGTPPYGNSAFPCSPLALAARSPGLQYRQSGNGSCLLLVSETTIWDQPVGPRRCVHGGHAAAATCV